jgi:hypothetical protein
MCVTKWRINCKELKIIMAGFSPLPDGFEMTSGKVDNKTLDKKGVIDAEMGF